MLTTFGERLQRLFGKLLDPMFSFGSRKVVVKELSWVCNEIGVTSIVIKSDEGRRHAASSLEEANSRYWEARGYQCDAQDATMAITVSSSKALDSAVADLATVGPEDQNDIATFSFGDDGLADCLYVVAESC
jgi:hypothetical protein